MLETLLREMDEEGVGDDTGETVVHGNEQVQRVPHTHALATDRWSVNGRHYCLQKVTPGAVWGLGRIGQRTPNRLGLRWFRRSKG